MGGRSLSPPIPYHPDPTALPRPLAGWASLPSSRPRTCQECPWLRPRYPGDIQVWGGEALPGSGEGVSSGHQQAPSPLPWGTTRLAPAG